MDIHKPKPWRGWRELLKEIGTIVIGVLIALGAEQSVEWLHRTTEVAEARTALHDEIRRDMTVLVLEGREDRCMDAMLIKFDAWAKGGPKPALGHDLLQSFRSSVWEVARTGAVPHMALKERLALANFYGGIENQNSIVNNIRGLMTDLRGDYNLPTLSPTSAEGVLRDVGRARSNFSGQAGNIPRLLELGRAVGVQPSAPFPEAKARVDELCRAAGVDG
jgi:hypothetical protein